MTALRVIAGGRLASATAPLPGSVWLTHRECQQRLRVSETRLREMRDAYRRAHGVGVESYTGLRCFVISESNLETLRAWWHEQMEDRRTA